jgi:hypothetical protein
VQGSSVSELTRTLIDQIKAAPEPVQREVLGFLALLKAREDKATDRDSLLPLADSAWAGDWNTAEEDDAWRGL